MYRNFLVGSAVIAANAFGTSDAKAPVPSFTSKLAVESGTGLAGFCTPSPVVDWADGNVLYGFQSRCLNATYTPPSAYILQDGKDNHFEYDLAIIGGGVQAAYLVNELMKTKPDAKIAVFEKGNHMGGRLMSAYGAGALGLGVNDPSMKTPPPEYGGMRIDPAGHWLVWDAIEEVVKHDYPDMRCGRKGQTKIAPIDPNLYDKFSEEDRTFGTVGDCDDYMVKMTTAEMRYAVNEKADPANFGEYLMGARMDDDGAIHATCLSMIGHTQTYIDGYMTAQEQTENTLDQAVNQACTNCVKVSQEFCDICAKFPQPGKNLVSCIGYDDLTQVPVASSIVDAAVVTGQGKYNCQKNQGSTDNCANLYLFRYGAQAFAQSLLNINKAVGPIYGKNLVSVSIEGQDVKSLAAKQANSVAGSKDNQKSETPTATGRVSLRFGDNSVAVAKAVYMTMLPFDMIEVDGLEAWTKPMFEGMLPFGATKLFISWADGMPKAISDATKSGGVRLVTDGDRAGQMARQIFFWDENTILVYQTAPMDNDLPANVMQQMIQNEGMDQMIGGTMAQLQSAFRTEFRKPTWARVKAWGNGALSYYRPGCGTLKADPIAFQSRVQRPLGQEMPVFYGSSEISAGGGGSQGTGWVMGSFMEVQLHLKAILDFI